MSWIPAFLLGGVDVDEEQKRQQELDAQLAALNRSRLDAGIWDQNTYDQANAHLEASRIDDVSGEVDNAFQVGWNEGVDNIRGTAGAIIGTPFRLIPPIGWAILVVALLVYMGGWARLKNMLK